MNTSKIDNGKALKGARELVWLPISSLAAYEKNSRTHTPAQVQNVAASIVEFGFTNPVLIDEKNVIIAGHCRVEAATSLGMDEVPTIQLPYLTDAQRRALVIADNRLGLDAGWDEKILAEELGNLKAEGFDLDVIGFNQEELDNLLGDSEPEPDGDADAAPEPPAIPVSVRGDVWLLGKHRLLCGDATMIDDVHKLMDGKVADLVVTDPPYNVAIQGGNHGDPNRTNGLKIQNDSMSDSDFYQFLLNVYTNLFTVMSDGAGIYVFHADSEGMNFRKAMLDAGFKLAQCCVWVKSSLVMGRQDYQWKHEPILYGWKPTAAHRWYSDRSQTTVWNFDRPNRSAEHPTMKPVDLVAYPIENSSRKGDLVLDLFGGSGSTLIACEKTGRSCVTMELDEKYVDVIVTRWQEYTGKKATHADTRKTFDEMRSERNV